MTAANAEYLRAVNRASASLTPSCPLVSLPLRHLEGLHRQIKETLTAMLEHADLADETPD